MENNIGNFTVDTVTKGTFDRRSPLSLLKANGWVLIDLDASLVYY